VLWIWWLESQAQSLLDTLALTWPVTEMTLNWDVVLLDYGHNEREEWFKAQQSYGRNPRRG
jgi:hypothetical protein